MIDVLDGQGKKINVDKLSYHLGVPVVATSALKQTGVDQVVKRQLIQRLLRLVTLPFQYTMIGWKLPFRKF